MPKNITHLYGLTKECLRIGNRFEPVKPATLKTLNISENDYIALKLFHMVLSVFLPFLLQFKFKSNCLQGRFIIIWIGLTYIVIGFLIAIFWYWNWPADTKNGKDH